MQAFNLTLLSNNSTSKFPENSLSTFTNYLPLEIQLTGEWVCGVSEIYINKFDTDFCRSRRQADPTELLKRMEKFIQSHPEKAAQLTLLSKRIKEEWKAYSENLVVTQVNLNKHAQNDDFWGDIDRANQLLAAENQSKSSQTEKESIESIDCVNSKENNLNFMFLYCDLIKARLIGENLYQCLKVIPVTKAEQLIKFNNIEYYPLQTTVFHSVSVSLQNDIGAKIKFESSVNPTMVTIRFKRLN